MPLTYCVTMEIIRTQSYIKALKKLKISQQDENRLLAELSDNPEKGRLIVGGGGIRKIRMALGDKGKSGSARAIYCYFSIKDRLFLFTVYPKNQKENLTKSEINQFSIIVNLIKKEMEK